ncbi:unnamed protein product [Acanthoscelides obtectus]|uniref:Ell-associated factor Eaf n=1 Tax=Acanthoscelides obtectus TaxID=200917 RepID=A0A9P0VT79_ACAOB|nr:unnamed protein product [Acanthoscelides obtectus]CAK1682643.1 Ell-associated factor Eaf [Acanthoscelides obtectus]
MAEKLGLGNEVRELKIGQSFTNPKSTAFHTVKYDFKPASVDTNKKATVDVAGNNQVTVTVPHLDGAGVPQTVFKGSQRPYQKECVLIIDRATGEITLEKLSYNIQVKKTRSEYNKLHQDRLSSSQGSNSGSGRSQTPPVAAPTPQRVSTKTRVTTSAGIATMPNASPPASLMLPPNIRPLGLVLLINIAAPACAIRLYRRLCRSHSLPCTLRTTS